MSCVSIMFLKHNAGWARGALNVAMTLSRSLLGWTHCDMNMGAPFLPVGRGARGERGERGRRGRRGRRGEREERPVEGG